MTQVLLCRDAQKGRLYAKHLQQIGPVYLCTRAESVKETLARAFQGDDRAIVVFAANDEEDRRYWQDAVDGKTRQKWIKIG